MERKAVIGVNMCIVGENLSRQPNTVAEMISICRTGLTQAGGEECWDKLIEQHLPAPGPHLYDPRTESQISMIVIPRG